VKQKIAYREPGVGLLAMLTLAGCDATERVQFDAIRAKAYCIERAAAELGIAIEGLEEANVTAAMGSDKALRFLSTGQFVITFDKPQLKVMGRSVSVTCIGDFNRRTITSLQLDGVIKRPAKPEDWTFS